MYSTQQIFSDKIYKEINETTIAIENYLSGDRYDELHEIIERLNDSDLTDILQTIQFDRLEQFIKLIQDRLNGNMLTALDESRTKLVYDVIGIKEFANIINSSDTHTYYDFIHHHQDLKDYEDYEIFFRALNEDKQLALEEFFKYPKNSAARLMQKNFIYFEETKTISRIKSKLLTILDLSQDIDCILLIDENHKVTGTLSFADILKTPSDTIASEVMKKHFIVVNTTTGQKKVMR